MLMKMKVILYNEDDVVVDDDSDEEDDDDYDCDYDVLRWWMMNDVDECQY